MIDFSFRIRVRAMNTIGCGPFSSIIRCQTKSLPPDPPRLECIGITCNSIKLKWGNGTVNHTLSPTTEASTTNTPRSITYIIEMEGKDGRFVQNESVQSFRNLFSFFQLSLHLHRHDLFA